jgi:hypothetical protein
MYFFSETMTDPVIPIKAVEGLMTKAFIEQSVASGLFWDALLKCHLYVPVSEKPEQPAGDDEIPVLLGVGSTGELVIWLFTSPEAMNSYTERKLTYRELPARTLLASVSDSDHDVVLIGPDGLTLSLHPDLIATLADGKVPEPAEEPVKTLGKQAQIYVGPPSMETKPLEQRFVSLFEKMPQVQEATFLQVSDDAGPRLLLGLRLNEGTEDALREVAGHVARAAEGILEKGQTMDITLIDRSLKAAFEKWGKPFFKRQGA